MVYRLDNQGVAGEPVIAIACEQPNPDGITAGHQPIAVVLDLMHPVRPVRRLLARRWQAGLDKQARPFRHDAIMAHWITVQRV